MTTTIEVLRAAALLSPLDEHFARALARLSGETRPDVLLAAALASQHVSAGHVCLDLSRFIESPLLIDAESRPLIELSWPTRSVWITALRSSPLVSDGALPTPLVLDEAGRLYLYRYWEHECRLAEALRARAAWAAPSLDGAWLNATLDRLFPPDASTAGRVTEPDWQRMAAVLTLYRRFCVISGGPGTGKTFTVVKILALLLEEARHSGAREPRITLLAPTGKAAARLRESIRTAKRTLPCSPAVLEHIPDDTATIHRCLGSVGGSATNFRHHAGNPLLADVVLVDEASMVDLGLMSRLVAAIPSPARLILLGDKDQLASVEAGAVLGDVCNTGGRHSYSAKLVETVGALAGRALPSDPQGPRATGIWDCIVHLTKSYRYGAGSGIGMLAQAINAGDSDAALAILESSEYPDAARAEPMPGASLGKRLQRTVVRGFRPYLEEQDFARRLQALERFRVLCAHRHGPSGVEEINRQIEAALHHAGLIRAEGTHYTGQPVMVTRNDYQLNLFNGDVGLFLNDPVDTTRTIACFAAAEGGLRILAPSRLPPYETVFAMSVHKSQGSEFDEVVVVLPERVSPVMTRELLYTAVTRARRKVTLYASREVIARAIASRIQRASGLRDRLWH